MRCRSGVRHGTLVLRDEFSDLALTDPLILELITGSPEDFFSLFDLLWVGLAVYTAWRFLAPDPPAHPAAATQPDYGQPEARPDDAPR